MQESGPVAVPAELRDITLPAAVDSVAETAKLRDTASTPPSGGTLTETVLAKVFRAIRADRITPADVARDLDIHATELNKHVFGLAPTPIDGGASRTRTRGPL